MRSWQHEMMTTQLNDETSHRDEPNFELTKAELRAEQDALGLIAKRNRMRVLIPLGLLIVLWFVLGLFGDPIPPAAEDGHTPVTTEP
ncbi:MAG: hypothetical protein VX589_18865 [Myxococcota bacterium]|nr:hypothetical protein [Myxococcota bacterium]